MQLNKLFTNPFSKQGDPTLITGVGVGAGGSMLEAKPGGLGGLGGFLAQPQQMQTNAKQMLGQMGQQQGPQAAPVQIPQGPNFYQPNGGFAGMAGQLRPDLQRMMGIFGGR